MLVLFEVLIARGADPEKLLSPEIQRDAKAQVLTVDEARKLGFAGLPDPPDGREVRLIVAQGRDVKWIQHALEISDKVDKMRSFELE